MSNDEIRKKAIEIAKKAVEKDREKNIEMAYDLYKQAIKHFIHIQKRKI
jgi:MIT (microtubule interacting and transport) domain